MMVIYMVKYNYQSNYLAVIKEKTYVSVYK